MRGGKSMFKKFFSIYIFVLVLFACSITAMATDIHSSINSEMTTDVDKNESSIADFFKNHADSAIEKIEDDFVSFYGEMENNKNFYTGLSFIPDLSYKVYTLNNENVVTKYNQSGVFGNNISENYIFKIPIQNSVGQIIGVASLYNVDGKYILGEYGKINEKEMILFDITAIKDSLCSTKTNIFSSIENIKAFVMNEYNTYALYIESSDGEYIMPISSDNDVTTLSENEIYTTADFVKVLQKNSREGEAVINEKGEILYGAAYIENNSSINKNMTLMIFSILAILILVIVIKKYKLFTKNN